jgi:hypothetical protein
MTSPGVLDLIALVPGKDDREGLSGILSRRQSLGIRAIASEILVHTRRDPGCFREAPEILQTYQTRARQALVMFDHEGSGQEERALEEVQDDLRGRLSRSGWEERAEVVVIRPELEVWVWSDSPIVEKVLGWSGRTPGLRDWLRARDFWPEGAQKPPRPKECLREALRAVRRPLSSAIFRGLAERVSLERCRDPSFVRLTEILEAWFPVERGGAEVASEPSPSR